MTDPLPHRARGEGDPPIVLIHGFGADRLSWSALVPALSARQRTIAFDLPGHGEAADWPEVPDAKVCARAVATSLEALAIPRATVVGHSLGGAVAALVALTRSDLVERLVLLAPGGFGPAMNVALLRRFAEADGEAEIAAALSGFFGPRTTIPKALPRLIAQGRTQTRRAALSAILERIVRGDGQGTLPLDALAAGPFSVTLVWGEADQVLPVEQCRTAPAPMARHVLSGVGHMPHLEAPEQTLAIIKAAVERPAA